MTDQVFIETLNHLCKDTLNNTLNITYTEASKADKWLKATMPVNASVHQPMGLLHGGASLALAETVGSAGSMMYIDLSKQSVVGLEINGNHLKAVKDGSVTAEGRIVHLGKTTHLWEIKILNEKGELVSLCKMTNLVINK